ncbi:MAG: TldD/PmbA family protein [Bdellovibrionota bacterium]
MLQKSYIEKLIPILKRDAKRALKMSVPGFKRPYYCSFLLKDTEWFNTWASSGSTYRKRNDRTRNVYCDIRVGSYRYDQTSDGALFDNDKELESYQYVTAPIDDKDYDGLRIALWRLAEAKVREAIADFNYKQAARVSTVDKNKGYPSFQRVKPVKHKVFSKKEYVDHEQWARFCKRASKWLSQLPQVSSNFVEVDTSQSTRILINTENTEVVQHEQIFSLVANIRHLNAEGSYIEQELVVNCGTQKELPDMRKFKKLMLDKYELMLRVIKAKQIHSFSGPVLLYPGPAGLLFHEAIGHRLEGNRLLSTGEGQTFKGSIGKRVVNVPVTLRDDPTLKKFDGRKCIGAYEIDDEGVPAENTVLVEGGILKGFLSSRAATSKAHRSNGHARTAKYQRPISRMGVTIIEGEDPVSMDMLRDKLLQEIKDQGKPFGMIVYDTCGGETDTSSYDFQAFAGVIAFATLVYPNGKEVPVRGVDFVGTPLQALNNIIAVGDELELDNGYCGAESGFIPVSTISPAVLLDNLELQAKEEELVTQFILSSPRAKN